MKCLWRQLIVWLVVSFLHFGLVAAPKFADVCAHMKLMLARSPNRFRPADVVELINPGWLNANRSGPFGAFPHNFLSNLVIGPATKGEALTLEQTDLACVVKGVPFLGDQEFVAGHAFGQEAEFHVMNVNNAVQYLLATKTAVLDTTFLNMASLLAPAAPQLVQPPLVPSQPTSPDDGELNFNLDEPVPYVPGESITVDTSTSQEPQEVRSAIIIASSMSYSEIFGLQNIGPGFTIRTRMAPVAGTSSGDLMLELGLHKGLTAMIFMPAGATMREQIKIEFDAKPDKNVYWGKVFCGLRVMRAVFAFLLKETESNISNLFDICIKAEDIDVVQPAGAQSPTFVLRGQPLNHSGEVLGTEVMLKLWREAAPCVRKDAAQILLQPTGKQCEYQRVTFGYRLGPDVQMEAMHPLLRILNNAVKNTTITFTNAAKVEFFDKQLVNRGLTVAADLTSPEALSELFSGLGDLRLQVHIPLGRDEKNKEKVLAQIVRKNNQKFSICLSGIPGLVDVSKLNIPGMTNLSSLCLEPQGVNVLFARDGKKIFDFDGSAIIGTARLNAHVTIRRGTKPKDDSASLLFTREAQIPAHICLKDLVDVSFTQNLSLPLLSDLATACIAPETIKIELSGDKPATAEFTGQFVAGQLVGFASFKTWEEDKIRRYAFAARLPGSHNPVAVYEALSAVSDTISFKDAAISMTNAAKPYVLGLKNEKNVVTNVQIDPGVTLEAEPVLGGFLKDAIGHLPGGDMRLRVRVSAPFKRPLTASDMNISFVLTDSNDSAHPMVFCAKTMSVLGMFTEIDVPIVSQVMNSCLTVNMLGARIEPDKGLILEIGGVINIPDLGQANVALRFERSGIMVAFKFGDLAFKKIDANLSQLDELFGISEAHIFLSTIPGNKPAKPGVTIQAVTKAGPTSVVGTIFEQVGVKGAVATIYIPPGTKRAEIIKRVKDVQIELVEDKSKGLCPGVALSGGGGDAQPPNVLTDICMRTSAGIVPGMDGIWIFGEAYVKDVKVGERAMAKLGIEDGKLLASFGVEFTGNKKPSDIDPNLAFMDALVFINPTVMFSRTLRPAIDLFDVTTKDGESKIDPTAPSVLVARPGLSISTEIGSLGPLADVLKPLLSTDTHVRATVNVPLVRPIKPENIKIALMVRTDKQLCASSLGLDIGPLKKLLGSQDACLAFTSFDVARVNQGMVVMAGGDLKIGDQDIPVVYVFDLSGEKPAAMLVGQGKRTLDLGDFGPGAAALAGIATLSDPVFIVANNKMNFGELAKYVTALRQHKNTLERVNPGASIVARANFGSSNSVFARVLSMFGLHDVDAILTLPANLSNAAGYSLEARMQYEKPQRVAGEILNIEGLAFKLQGGTPPKMGILVDALFRFPGSTDQQALELTGSVSGPAFSLSGTLFCTSQSCPSIKLGSPFPLNVTLRATKDVPLGFALHVVGGSPVGIGGSGVLDLDGKHAQIAFNLNPAKIKDESGIKGSFDRLCLSDTLALSEKLLGAVGVPFKLPNVFCITDAKFSAAAKEVNVGTISIEPGLNVSGNISSDLLPLHGSVQVRVIPLSLISVITHADQIGLYAKAQIDPIVLGGDLLRLTDTAGKQGPTFEARATATGQYIRLDGAFDLAKVLSGSFDAEIDLQSMHMRSQRKVAGVSAQFECDIPIPVANAQDLEKARAQFVLDANELTGTVADGVHAGVQQVFDQVNAAFSQITAAQDRINDICSQLPGPLTKVCDGPKSSADKILSPARTMFEELKKIAQDAGKFDITQAVIEGNLHDVISLTLPRMHLTFVVAGKSETISLENVSLKDPRQLIVAIEQALIKIFIAQFTQGRDRLHDFAGKMDELAEQVAKDIASDMGDLLKAGVGVAFDAARDVTTQLAGLVGAGDLVGGAFGAVSDVSGMAFEEIGKTVAVAQEAAQQASQAAEQAAKAAQQAAQEAARFVSEAAQKVAAAMAEAAQAVAQEVARIAQEALDVLSSCFGLC